MTIRLVPVEKFPRERTQGDVPYWTTPGGGFQIGTIQSPSLEALQEAFQTPRVICGIP
jgi:hypothetical protein